MFILFSTAYRSHQEKKKLYFFEGIHIVWIILILLHVKKRMFPGVVISSHWYWVYRNKPSESSGFFMSEGNGWISGIRLLEDMWQQKQHLEWWSFEKRNSCELNEDRLQKLEKTRKLFPQRESRHWSHGQQLRALTVLTEGADLFPSSLFNWPTTTCTAVPDIQRPLLTSLGTAYTWYTHRYDHESPHPHHATHTDTNI